jgi:arylsulfatase A-like enzyme
MPEPPKGCARVTGTVARPHAGDTGARLMVMGPGIRPGRHNRMVALNDLAPTLATLLGIETPSGSSGETLVEILDAAAEKRS